MSAFRCHWQFIVEILPSILRRQTLILLSGILCRHFTAEPSLSGRRYHGLAVGTLLSFSVAIYLVGASLSISGLCYQQFTVGPSPSLLRRRTLAVALYCRGFSIDISLSSPHRRTIAAVASLGASLTRILCLNFTVESSPSTLPCRR